MGKTTLFLILTIVFGPKHPLKTMVTEKRTAPRLDFLKENYHWATEELFLVYFWPT
ncbi:MAG: hypothetical protein AAGA86_05990 [Bacteroidota bacterium]